MINRQEKGQVKKNGFRNLLLFLLLYLFGSPFLDPYASLALFAHASMSTVLFFSVYAVQKKHNHRSLAIAMLLPAMILYWLGIYELVAFSREGSYLFLAVYFGLLVYSFAAELSREKKITLNVLYGTLCLYLLIGLFWGVLYALLHVLSPGAYGGALLDSADGNILHKFTYFSMVTLTTLGYGDITPQTLGAGALCQMEAIVGQFFIAVVVAWLVGHYASEREETTK